MHHFWQRIQKGPLLAASLEESGSLRPVVVQLHSLHAGEWVGTGQVIFATYGLDQTKPSFDVHWPVEFVEDRTARFMRKMEDGGSPKMQLALNLQFKSMGDFTKSVSFKISYHQTRT